MRARHVKGLGYARRIRCTKRRGPPPSQKTHRGRKLDAKFKSRECYEVLYQRKKHR